MGGAGGWRLSGLIAKVIVAAKRRCGLLIAEREFENILRARWFSVGQRSGATAHVLHAFPVARVDLLRCPVPTAHVLRAFPGARVDLLRCPVHWRLFFRSNADRIFDRECSWPLNVRRRLVAVFWIGAAVGGQAGDFGRRCHNVRAGWGVRQFAQPVQFVSAPQARIKNDKPPPF